MANQTLCGLRPRQRQWAATVAQPHPLRRSWHSYGLICMFTARPLLSLCRLPTASSTSQPSSSFVDSSAGGLAAAPQLPPRRRLDRDLAASSMAKPMRPPSGLVHNDGSKAVLHSHVRRRTAAVPWPRPRERPPRASVHGTLARPRLALPPPGVCLRSPAAGFRERGRHPTICSAAGCAAASPVAASPAVVPADLGRWQ